jgi:glucose-1-phosphate thymidylyltransferase
VLIDRTIGAADGSDLGLRFSFGTQDYPRGPTDPFIVGREFVGTAPVALVLGDNIFHGHGLPELPHATNRRTDATVFGYAVSFPPPHFAKAMQSLTKSPDGL